MAKKNTRGVKAGKWVKIGHEYYYKDSDTGETLAPSVEDTRHSYGNTSKAARYEVEVGSDDWPMDFAGLREAKAYAVANMYARTPRMASYHIRITKNGASYGQLGPYSTRALAMTDAGALKNPGLGVSVHSGPPAYTPSRSNPQLPEIQGWKARQIDSYEDFIRVYQEAEKMYKDNTPYGDPTISSSAVRAAARMKLLGEVYPEWDERRYQEEIAGRWGTPYGTPIIPRAERPARRNPVRVGDTIYFPRGGEGKVVEISNKWAYVGKHHNEGWFPFHAVEEMKTRPNKGKRKNAGAVGKAQKFVYAYSQARPGGFMLSEITYRESKMHFAQLMKGAEALAKKGMIDFDGARVTPKGDRKNPSDSVSGTFPTFAEFAKAVRRVRLQNKNSWWHADAEVAGRPVRLKAHGNSIAAGRYLIGIMDYTPGYGDESVKHFNTSLAAPFKRAGVKNPKRKNPKELSFSVDLPSYHRQNWDEEFESLHWLQPAFRFAILGGVGDVPYLSITKKKGISNAAFLDAMRGDFSEIVERVAEVYRKRGMKVGKAQVVKMMAHRHSNQPLIAALKKKYPKQNPLRNYSTKYSSYSGQKRWSLLRRYPHQWTAQNSSTGAVVMGKPSEFQNQAWAARHGIPKYIVAEASR